MRRLSFILAWSILCGLLVPFTNLQTIHALAAEAHGDSIQFLAGPKTGDPLDIALAYLRSNQASLGLTSADLTDVAVTDRYTDAHNGVTHIYLRQRFKGIEVYQANINMNIARDGSVINMGNSFVANLSAKIKEQAPRVSMTKAVELAAQHLGLKPTKGFIPQHAASGANSATVLGDGGISRRAIPVKLVYQPTDSGVSLAWDVEIEQLDGQNYWNMRIDAANGAVLNKYNYVDNDNWGTPAQAHGTAAPAPNNTADEQAAPLLQTGSSYQVYAFPRESPNFGDRTTLTNPADSRASSYGWHDTNGVAGAEFTTTRGNNVAAAEAGNHPGFMPDGGASLNFAFPINLTQSPDTYEAAAITNLFYANNVLHDVFYRYGFTEAAGNFQTNNYGRGGAGNDAVIANAQDSYTANNASFSTQPDGSAGTMRMGLWTNTSPARDSDMDNGIIAHEYGHGISNRLTGGPANSKCLENAEQGGEGWSDWFALMMTMKTGDTGPMRRPIGTYMLGQPTTGNGIRAFPYSTNMSIDPRTYDTIKTNIAPHAVGSVWAAMLWEVTWGMVNTYGFNPNLYTGNAGNSRALLLIMDGLKFQPCSPGFVNARDAILLADRNDFGGVNQCLLWTAFAKRGLGYSASQGSSSSATDGTQAFNLPPACSSPPPTITITPTSTPTRTPPPTSTPTQPTVVYQGYMDGADCGSIWGWAWNQNAPNTPISVDIYADGALLGRTPASIFRQDLLNAGIGNGYHGFSYPVPASLRDGRAHSIQVRYAGTTLGLSSSPRPIACGVSLFPTQTPGSEASGQGQTWEQAAHFSSSVSGEITHIRFWKHCSETGTHVGRLWTDSGTQLGSALFTNETPCGWQKAELKPHIPISAGVRYRVSYNATLYVAKTFNVFGSPITNGPLTAYGASYSTPAGSFPTTGSTSNLFADVLFNSPR